MEQIHKFNNGNGATLCNICDKIITIGMTDDLFCDKHKNMKMDKALEIIETQKQLIDLLNDQVICLSLMSKIELGDDVSEEIQKLQSKLK
jgi:hypothetical protein